MQEEGRVEQLNLDLILKEAIQNVANKYVTTVQPQTKKERKSTSTVVVCAECKNRDGFICGLKKVKVSLNKKRTCNAFIPVDTIAQKIIPGYTSIPYSIQNKEERKALVRKEFNSLLLKYMKPVKEYVNTSSESFPLTGDLSRFTTTATD